VNRKIRYLLMGLALVVIAVLAWFLLVNPLRGDIATTKDSIASEQTRLATAQAKLAQAEATKEEGKKNQARLLELAKMVPESEEIPSLLIQIQDLADQSGIDFIAITPGDPVQAGDYLILPLDVEFTGTYFDLSDFVYRAEQMVAGPGRLLAIKSLDLQLGSQGGTESGSEAGVSPELAVTMTMYAFEYAAASATAAVPAAAQPATSSATSPGGTTSSTTPSGS
jgi:type IV pilus assembly protein PilO